LPRIVICDVNVLVNAVTRAGAPAEGAILAQVPPRTTNPWADTLGTLNSGQDFVLATSPHILWNVADVLINAYRWRRVQVEVFVALLLEIISRTGGTYIDPQSRVSDCAADEEDNRILELTLDADADLVVTEDHHLLELSPWRTVPIITAREFAGRVAVATRARAQRQSERSGSSD